MIIDMFKRSGKKREKEKWASSSESFSLVFEKRPLLAGKFRPFSLPHPTPPSSSFSCSLFFAPSSPSWPRLLKRWITLSTEKRKCFSLILTYPLDSAIQRLNIPGLNAWIRPPQPLVQEVFFPFSLRVSVETHLRLFLGERRLDRKNNQLPTFSQGRVLSRFYCWYERKRTYQANQQKFRIKNLSLFIYKTPLQRVHHFSFTLHK